MSIQTRCPMCHTVFRVDARYLAASNGMARCGICGMAFNVLEHHLPEQAGVSAPDHSIQTESTQIPALAEDDLDFMVMPPAIVVDSGQTSATAEAEVHDAASQVSYTDEPLVAKSEASVEPIRALGFEPPRSSHGVLWFWISSVLLMLLLAGQMGWYFRSTLALRLPALAPIAQDFCAMAGCHLGLPRDTDLLKIGSSEFNSDPKHANLLQMHLTVVNLSNQPIAYPSISLSLLNEADETIARKNLPPDAYLSVKPLPQQGLAAHSEWPIDLTLDVGTAQVSNYKLLLFYPPAHPV